MFELFAVSAAYVGSVDALITDRGRKRIPFLRDYDVELALAAGDLRLVVDRGRAVEIRLFLRINLKRALRSKDDFAVTAESVPVNRSVRDGTLALLAELGS